MNIQEYISTGILELYLLDDLSPGEREEVERNLAAYPELKAAMSEIENDLLLLDQQLAEHPSDAIKSKIFDSLSGTDDAPVRHLNPEKSQNQPISASRYLVAASIALALFTSAASLYFYSQWQSAASSYESILAENQRLADNVLETQQTLDQRSADLALITSDKTIEVALKGLPLQPSALAFVYFHPDNQDVYLKVSSLLDPGQLNDYQLWAIVDGKPLDIGIIDLSKASLIQRMKAVPSASAFAVTIEPKGGSESPTLDQMVVLGEVTS